MTDILIQSIKDRVATLTLNRPDSRNALAPDMRDRLLDALKSCADNPDVGAVVITGSGKAFCAGGDVKRMAESGAIDKAERLATLQLAHLIPELLASMPKVVIAAINGPAMGAGLALACACDLRIASTAARFGTSFINVALASDFGASWNLTRLVGSAKARQLLLMGDAIEATEAKAMGLVSRVCDPTDLAHEAHRLALRFANGPRIAQALLKKNLAAAATGSLKELLDLEAQNQVVALYTEDHREAVNAFLDKRTPVFQGR
jgi:2-(1,2-epoxy-1,2-dihydrophenyl)acetyl-CoA isomerase